MELLIFIFVGVFTGLSAGLFGVGGGIISVPAMVMILPYFDVPPQHIMQIAIATSLALIIPTSLISAYSHWRNEAILWPYVIQLTPGLVIGAFVGAFTVIFVKSEILQTLFSVFLILIALHMLKAKTAHVAVSHLGASKYTLVPAFVIGGISSLMGVGGGTMTVPYLTWRGVSLPKAIGTSAFCGLPIAASGSVLFFLLANVQTSVEPVSYIRLPSFVGILIGVVVFAPIGAKLAHHLNLLILKRIFVLMLLVVAVQLLFLR